jgi:UPF0716 family protein affecting phage T7 exclusion
MIDKFLVFLGAIWIGMTNPVTIGLVLGAAITICLVLLPFYVSFRVVRFGYRLAVATNRKAIEAAVNKAFDEGESEAPPASAPDLSVVG